MKKNSDVKNNKQAKKMILTGIFMLLVITGSIIVVSLRNRKSDNSYSGGELVPFGGNTVEYDESTLILENLPFIRLNYYDENTGIRSGLMITNDGNIYKYSFNETEVDYPDSDSFIINQTLYFENVVDEYGNIGEDDLNLLKEYTEKIGYEYANDEVVFDTIGNSISVTNYINEDNIVLINSEGIKNVNNNTDKVLEILAKYDIKL